MKVALFGATGGTSPGPYGFSVQGFEFLAWEPGLTVCMILLWGMNKVIACFTVCVCACVCTGVVFAVMSHDCTHILLFSATRFHFVVFL